MIPHECENGYLMCRLVLPNPDKLVLKTIESVKHLGLVIDALNMIEDCIPDFCYTLPWTHDSLLNICGA